jgi:hypothetical protein
MSAETLRLSFALSLSELREGARRSGNSLGAL